VDKKKSFKCGTLCVKISSLLGSYFGTHKWVREGDLVSPFLFDIAGDVMANSK
jgi:hypothetical protein